MTRIGLKLFAEHPTVKRLLDLNHAWRYFSQEAEKIEAGGKSPLEGLGADWFHQAAIDAEMHMVCIVHRIRIDGEPLPVLVGKKLE